MVKSSAPGKIHLIGEHSVCYGYPAIISAIEKRTVVKIKKAKKIKIKNNALGEEGEFEIKQVLKTAEKCRDLWQEGCKKNNFSKLFRFLKSSALNFNKAAVGLILEKTKTKKGFSLEVESELPLGMGLGSSASFSVSLSMAISEFLSIRLSKKEINQMAFEIEKINHGRPSGGDNFISTFGGTVWFERGKWTHINLPSFLKEIALVFLPRKKGTTTAKLIQKVRSLPAKLREEKTKNIASAAYKMREGIKKENPKAISDSINAAQESLRELGVSTPKVEKIVTAVRSIGGAAKLSGAGGGGAIICFHQDKKQLAKLLKSLSLDFFNVRLGAKGVKKYV